MCWGNLWGRAEFFGGYFFLGGANFFCIFEKFTPPPTEDVKKTNPLPINYYMFKTLFRVKAFFHNNKILKNFNILENSH